MFSSKKLAEIISAYKIYFRDHWKDEIYKWEAIEHFQKHWDSKAVNFLEMFIEATDKTYNLLANMNNYPRRMIKRFAEADAEAVRGMFMQLFDESKDLAQRIEQFQASAEELRMKYDDGTWGQHYQKENAITTYLWLRYPDKYYIYKYMEAAAFAKAIESDFIPKWGGGTFNVSNTFQLYDEARGMIKQDSELRQFWSGVLKDCHYQDPEMITVTIDIGHFVSRFYGKKEVVWFPTNYSPDLSVQDWKSLLQDSEVFTESSLQIMKRFLDIGGEATCTQLAEKYGEAPNFYNAGSYALAKRISGKTGCPFFKQDNGIIKYWPVLYVGHGAPEDMDGSYIWKLRDELKTALMETDLGKVELYAKKDSDEKEKIVIEKIDVEKLQSNARYKKWLNPVIVALRELGGSASIKEAHEKIIELYEISDEELSKVNQSGVATVINDIDWARNCLNYEGLIDSQAPRGIWSLSPLGERIVISDKLAGMICAKWGKISAAKRDNRPIPEINLKPYYEFLEEDIVHNAPYTKEDFLKEVYMADEKYDILAALLKNKKNLILQGAPGVGKTFCAKRLAYAMMGEKDDARIKLIQFHQNYSYEDFVMGYKPDGEGFRLEEGIFYRFCKEAKKHPDKSYFFIIDEINRGNMSKIFGELLMLIEKEYRGVEITLAYDKKPFSVPENLYIIGMMNTADRSLAMIDYALRRRFSFYEMEPGFCSDGFKDYQASLQNETFDALMEQVISLNREIRNDASLGEGFRIGHSYFCGQEQCSEEWMKSVVYYDIIPMLQEYWFDDRQKVQRWENNLSGVFND